MQTYNINTFLTMPPKDLLNLFAKDFDQTIPSVIETTDDMFQAEKALGRLAAQYSYLAQLSVYAKLDVREKKRTGKNKEDAEDAIDRKAVIDAFMSSADMKYKAVSRMLTTKQQINEELRMTNAMI